MIVDGQRAAAETVFSGVHKIDGGHWLQWSGRGEPTLGRYWIPTFVDTPGNSETELIRELHEILRESVADSLGDRPDVGAFLSGGLDSSTVTGKAARIRPALLAATLFTAACTMQGTDIPSLTGPSGLALSVTVRPISFAPVGNSLT